MNLLLIPKFQNSKIPKIPTTFKHIYTNIHLREPGEVGFICCFSLITPFSFNAVSAPIVHNLSAFFDELGALVSSVILRCFMK